MIELAQFQTHTIKMGPFLNISDLQPNTELTITPADVLVSKNWGPLHAKEESSSGSHDENGWYDITIGFDEGSEGACDTDLEGPLTVTVNKPGVLPVSREFVIIDPITDTVGSQIHQWIAQDLGTLMSRLGLPSGADFAEDIANVSPGGGNVIKGEILGINRAAGEFLDVIQGEAVPLEIIAIARGGFPKAEFDSITLVAKDSSDNRVTIEDASITRITERIKTQQFECEIPATETEKFEKGTLDLEVSFDDRKMQISQNIRILEAL